MVLQRANQTSVVVVQREADWRKIHFWRAWDQEKFKLEKDGNDDVMVLDLQTDITTQRVVTYLGPVTSGTQGIVTNLGPSQQNTYRAFTSQVTGANHKVAD